MKFEPIVFERNRCCVLTLVLKKKWFDMIASGEKNEEYRTSRNICVQIDRWHGRAMTLVEAKNGADPVRDLMVVKFCWGYGKDRPTLLMHATGVTIRTYAKHPEWGEPDEPHLVIALGFPVEFAS